MKSGTSFKNYQLTTISVEEILSIPEVKKNLREFKSSQKETDRGDNVITFKHKKSNNWLRVCSYKVRVTNEFSYSISYKVGGLSSTALGTYHTHVGKRKVLISLKDITSKLEVNAT